MDKLLPKHSLRARQDPPKSCSIVVPCFNEEEVIAETYRRLKVTVSALEFPVELLFIDDGSTDATWSVLRQLQLQDSFVKIVRLSRNFGHQTALTCGLDQARGEIVVIMDADLQDPPELLPEMIGQWQQGFDIVFGQRRTRNGETRSKKLFAFLFYRLFTKFTGFQIPPDAGDFRLMDRRAVSALQSLRERHRFVRGMVSWIGYHQTAIQYDRPERFAGKTKYPFKKSVFLAIDAITSFSYVPLRLAAYLGVVVSCFASLYILVIVALKILGINYPGYTSLMASILLLGGVQLIVLGMIGEYVGRIFEQGQGRPLYLLDEVQGEPLAERAEK